MIRGLILPLLLILLFPLGRLSAAAVWCVDSSIAESGNGEACFIPIFEEITGSAPSVHGPNAAATSRNCIAWWDRNKEHWLIPSP